jgi:hypothetical protein
MVNLRLDQMRAKTQTWKHEIQNEVTPTRAAREWAGLMPAGREIGVAVAHLSGVVSCQLEELSVLSGQWSVVSQIKGPAFTADRQLITEN